jgi:hypothetical protein
VWVEAWEKAETVTLNPKPGSPPRLGGSDVNISRSVWGGIDRAGVGRGVGEARNGDTDSEAGIGGTFVVGPLMVVQETRADAEPLE